MHLDISKIPIMEKQNIQTIFSLLCLNRDYKSDKKTYYPSKPRSKHSPEDMLNRMVFNHSVQNLIIFIPKSPGDSMILTINSFGIFNDTCQVDYNLFFKIVTSVFVSSNLLQTTITRTIHQFLDCLSHMM